jgi:hypothetical protein
LTDLHRIHTSGNEPPTTTPEDKTMATNECFSFGTEQGRHGCLSHEVNYPTGPIVSIRFGSNYDSVMVGQRQLEKIADEDDPTRTLIKVARNRRFFDVRVCYRDHA